MADELSRMPPNKRGLRGWFARGRWVLARLFWHPFVGVVGLVYAVIVAIQWWADQFASAKLQERLRLGNNIPSWDGWQWVSVGLAILLGITIYGAWRQFSAYEGALMAALREASGPPPDSLIVGDLDQKFDSGRIYARTLEQYVDHLDGVSPMAFITLNNRPTTETLTEWQDSVIADLAAIAYSDIGRFRDAKPTASDSEDDAYLLAPQFKDQVRVLGDILNEFRR